MAEFGYPDRLGSEDDSSFSALQKLGRLSLPEPKSDSKESQSVVPGTNPRPADTRVDNESKPSVLPHQRESLETD
jgi:hypothetical protein